MKTLFLSPHISQLTIVEGEHINDSGLPCHGEHHIGDRSTFTWHLSVEVKEFVMKLLKDRHNVP